VSYPCDVYRAGGEDDFDMFMECVKAKSHHAQARINSQGTTGRMLVSSLRHQHSL